MTQSFTPPLLLVCFLLLAQLHAEVITAPERAHDTFTADSLTLPAPIKRWDNALPLGNGLTGGLLWGEGSELRLSLDRGDLWDERGNAEVYDPKRSYETLLQNIQDKDTRTWKKYFDTTYFKSKWTKIPGGRLVISLPDGTTSKRFHLDFPSATAEVQTTTQAVQMFFSAASPVALARVPAGSTFELLRPDSLDSLGYPPADFSRSDHGITYTQETAEKLVYAFAVEWKTLENQTLVAIASASNEQGGTPSELARAQALAALSAGWDKLHAAHLEWWKAFYHTSTVQLPAPRLQTHYNLVKYFYGSASRADAPPMPLQGIWTADEGKLPPWKGDYHNDLNTQMTYVAWQAAGLKESGMSYLNFYLSRLPQFRKYGKDFFGLDTAMVPGVMTLQGQAMGGWPPYAMGLTAGLWNGHAFYQYWKTSQDPVFLSQNAYPFLAEIATSTLALTKEKNGKLYLITSSSPEWNGGGMRAYLTPNSNFDQALLTWSLLALKEMAQELDKTDDFNQWEALLQQMPPLQVSAESNALLISKGIEFKHSHRHFSHALAIHPLGILNIDQGSAEKEQVRATVRQIIDNGSRAWTGYSFTWAASLAARAGFADDAARLLSDFERGFVTRNGFHVNGDQTRSGLSKLVYRPFTLEGNFLFMDAVQEMLLQSWGNKVRIFPAVPDSWRDSSFKDLRAEGGFIVSAKRKNCKTIEVTITATTDSTLRLRNPFKNSPFKSNYPHTTEGDLLVFPLKAGDTLELQSI
ncbi:glycoside hydrolase N-terminal domain-containing protein [Coraliomargarita algicola]|uniref:Glycoside hydrolase N-terminal domain-containing protein n=1 Tax=Coraliomargarita algicola TaxID=3092156 RepID=A0ABZ0RJK2_9BACT|nr:glycoside hydrolase N-terminal domain-containing protein [Coraliomargarita sp. J2-16]WPJ95155.1 glycoside hydrolase N-terminal domain-containing protein [Coraliomargarita sp. J2-16]